AFVIDSRHLRHCARDLLLKSKDVSFVRHSRLSSFHLECSGRGANGWHLTQQRMAPPAAHDGRAGIYMTSLGRVLVRTKDALWRTVEAVPAKHTLQMAAALSYYFVISLFPAFLLVSAILAYLPGAHP